MTFKRVAPTAWMINKILLQFLFDEQNHIFYLPTDS